MESLFKTIPGVLKDLGIALPISSSTVFAAWKRCAGEQVAGRTVAKEFQNDRLVIAVEDLTWKRNLEELSPQMLQRLNACLADGAVKFIEFRVDEKLVSDSKNARVKRAADEEVVRLKVDPALVVAAGSIADDNLRSSFLKASAIYEARRVGLSRS